MTCIEGLYSLKDTIAIDIHLDVTLENLYHLGAIVSSVSNVDSVVFPDDLFFVVCVCPIGGDHIYDISVKTHLYKGGFGYYISMGYKSALINGDGFLVHKEILRLYSSKFKACLFLLPFDLYIENL